MSSNTINGSRISVKRVRQGLSIHHYEATLEEGVWPSREELLYLCDINNLGGDVQINGLKARVEVYVD